MADAKIENAPIVITGTAECVARPNAVRLDEYPLLAYSPEQYPGRGVVTENNGTSVLEIAQAYAINANAQAIADQFAIGLEHVAQAIAYAIATALATTAPTETK